jgi:hypothetical protein
MVSSEDFSKKVNIYPQLPDWVSSRAPTAYAHAREIAFRLRQALFGRKIVARLVIHF